MSWTFTAELWRWGARQADGPSSWIFLTLPAEVSEELRLGAGEPRGFGSVRVHVEASRTSWDTSVFPDAAGTGCFVLPVKKAVRDAEGVTEGDDLTVAVSPRRE